MRNRTMHDGSFTEAEKQAVWNKAAPVPRVDPSVLRKCACGAWIKRDMYGDSSEGLSMGWEIDHIFPVSKGGTDHISNLQPMQWENNRGKGDDYPQWNCKVIAEGEGNVYKT